MTKTLGRFTKVDLRDVWGHEARDFTKWLAEEENLALLGDELGIELELVGTEVSVGRFSADILCADSTDSSGVLIENQLEKTNHGHLGQLMTYAAGRETDTVIWIARQFEEEHRAALDWLNHITEKRFRFFGIQIEVWQIGDSAPAPRFNIVSKPNNWSREVASQAKNVPINERQKLQEEYWTAFNVFAEGSEKGSLVKGRTPPIYQKYIFSLGKAGVSIALTVLMRRGSLRVGILTTGKHKKGFFESLCKQKEEIEAELGFSLDWNSICVEEDNLEPQNKDNWPRCHEWMLEKLDIMNKVFRPRVRDLEPDDSQSSIPEDDDEDEED